MTATWKSNGPSTVHPQEPNNGSQGKPLRYPNGDPRELDGNHKNIKWRPQEHPMGIPWDPKGDPKDHPMGFNYETNVNAKVETTETGNPFDTFGTGMARTSWRTVTQPSLSHQTRAVRVAHVPTHLQHNRGLPLGALPRAPLELCTLE